MKRLVFTGLWLLIPLGVLAHSPSQSSTILVEGDNGNWTLQIRAALTAFEHVVHEKYTANGYGTPKEFEGLVLGLLSNHMQLHVDGETIALKNPKVKLGHETVVAYQVKLPDSFEMIEVKNNLFQNIYKSKNAFMILKKGMGKKMVNLEKENDYVVRLEVENNEFVILDYTIDHSQISEKTFFVIALVLIVFTFSMVLGLKPLHQIEKQTPIEHSVKP